MTIDALHLSCLAAPQKNANTGGILPTSSCALFRRRHESLQKRLSVLVWCPRALLTL